MNKKNEVSAATLTKPEDVCDVNYNTELAILEGLGARFCRIGWGQKFPNYNNWQNTPLSIHELDLQRTGVGILLGQGNLVAIDIDNQPGCDRFINLFGQSPQEFRSVSWASGKRFDGSFCPEISLSSNIQVLFRLTPDQARNLSGRKTFENNSLDIRWSGSQSVLPSLAPHPETKQPYSWVNSPREVAIADMPDVVWHRMLSELEATPTQTAASLPLLLDIVDKVPLINCLAKHHRQLIESGVSQGGRNDTGTALARDLIGTATRLDYLSIRYNDRPDDLFEQFCDRCTPPISLRERKTIWESAVSSNPTPCLTDEMIENCVKAWQRQKQRPVQPSKHQPSKPSNERENLERIETANNSKKKYDTDWADEIAAINADKLAWDDIAKQWRRYGVEAQGVWSVISETRIFAIIKKYIQSQGLGCNAGKLSSIEKILRGSLDRDNCWDKTPNIIAYRDGIYDLDTNQLKHHSPSYGLTWALDYDYFSESDSWQKVDDWLNFVTQGKKRDKDILIAYSAATLRGRADLHKVLLLKGPGGTGKSTFMRLVVDLIGKSNTRSSSLSDLSSNRFESANIYKKRLTIFPDENNKIRNIERFKKLTGQDPVPGEEKGKK